MKNNGLDLILSGSDRESLGIFDPFFNDFFDFPVISRKELHKLNNMLKTDVKEVENGYALDIEMPGIEKKDINLDLKDGYLTVTAKREHNVNDENKKENYIRRERSFGQFSRSFYVGDIKQEDVDAKLENGILKITLPKEQKKVETANQIEIK